ncbi:MOSC domain-containing protein [Xanthovirga aplysinae]|uniref:MOSC domain-containing protein n=1 Tax=Xanthovirga aplysinae TaxID=2529853 RepID=UPI0012BC226F|nr:MOSC domain-containing protein [Xanthovirga aplysinae]MTI30872.1 MOSC domain-containing protein [Xanthovirga aplysinae]
MKIISIQTGKPKTISVNGRDVVTSIFKYPIDKPVKVNFLGIESDTQSDLKVHGGKFKAVYAYPSEHYPYWKELLAQYDFEWGAFGENLVTTGLLEQEIFLGDTLKMGNVLLRVTQPRFPCYKLGVKFNDGQMIAHFHRSGRSGFYFEVLEEGSFQKGDSIQVVEKRNGTSISKFVKAKTESNPNPDTIKSILDDPNLIDEWRSYFSRKLVKLS